MKFTTFLFNHTLWVVGFFLFTSATEAKSAHEKYDRMQAVIEDYKNTFKVDKVALNAINSSLSLVSDADRLLSHPDIDLDLKSRLERVRNDAVSKLASQDEKMVAYIALEYARTYRDSSGKESDERRGATVRFQALEEVFNQLGVKAIPVLTELHTSAIRTRAKLFGSQVKEVITRIARQGDLAVEKAKIQMELGKREAAQDSAPSGFGNVEPAPLPRDQVGMGAGSETPMIPKSSE